MANFPIHTHIDFVTIPSSNMIMHCNELLFEIERWNKNRNETIDDVDETIDNIKKLILDYREKIKQQN